MYAIWMCRADLTAPTVACAKRWIGLTLLLLVSACGEDAGEAAGPVAPPAPQSIERPTSMKLLVGTASRASATEISSSGKLCLHYGGSTGEHDALFYGDGKTFNLSAGVHELEVVPANPGIATWLPSHLVPFRGKVAGWAVGSTTMKFELSLKSGEILFTSAPVAVEVFPDPHGPC